LFEVINNFRLYDRVCFVSALNLPRDQPCITFSEKTVVEHICNYSEKLIIQFFCKSRAKFFKSTYSIIEQYLLNKNKRATMLKSKKKFDLNKASHVLQVLPQALFSFQNFSKFSVMSNLWKHLWSIKYRRK